MLRVLIPIDGSENSLRALDYVLRRKAHVGAVEIHLLNVQIPVVSGHAKMFVSHEQLNAYYRQEGEQALQTARDKLEQAGVPYQHHILVGHVADTIVAYAKQNRCDEVVVGTRGMSAISNLVLGSVATQVIHLSDIPITLVK